MKPEIKNKIIEIIKSNNIRGTNTFGNWYRLCVVTYQDEVIQEPMSRGTRLKNAIRKILGRDTIQPSYQTKKVESTPIRCEYELVSKKDNIIQIIIIENNQIIENRRFDKDVDKTKISSGSRDVIDIMDTITEEYTKQTKQGHGPVFTPAELQQSLFLDSILGKQK